MSEAFDEYALSYESAVQRSIAFSGLGHDFFLRSKVSRLAELFAKRFGGTRPRLLDIGCGVGRMHPFLSPLLSGLAGSDVSGEAIVRARRDNPGVEYRQSSAESLPWPSRYFDVTLAVCVLHHVPPQNRLPLIAEMRRVTVPGGLVVIIEHNPWNPMTRLAVARCPFDSDAELLGARSARTLLQRASLDEVESGHFLLFPTSASWVARIERFLRRMPFGAQYITAGVV